MKKYVIFTTVGGYVFYICCNEKRGVYVSSDAPDDEVMKFDEENKQHAYNIAERNSDEKKTYQVKEIIL